MAASTAGVPSGQPRISDSEGRQSSPGLMSASFQTTRNGRVLVLRQTSGSRPSSVSSTTSDSNGSSIGSRGPRPNRDICIGEELRIAVDRVLNRFKRTEDYEEVEFPSSLTAAERAYVHRLASTLGLKSKSHGKGAARHLSVTKKIFNSNNCAVATLRLSKDSVQCIHSLLQKFPVTSKERQDLLPHTTKATETDGLKDLFKMPTGRLNSGVPQVPPQKCDSPLSSVRLTLPICHYESEILNAVQSHQVTLIVGETGSGKTTQVPQMILESCCELRSPCRIICTQPRRIAALSIAERVAGERGEKIGQTVGYQIRLESRVSPKTLLTFCTNGVLLRTLMGGDGALEGITHVIVDEVHERDKYSDFLLICMQMALGRFRNLKLIAMSASLNVDLFLRYFDGCGLVRIPGRLFEVKQWFLEDILRITNYSNSKMQKFTAVIQSERQRHNLKEWCDRMVVSSDVDKKATSASATQLEDIADIDAFVESDEIEPVVSAEMDELLSKVWMTGNEDVFNQIFHLLGTEKITVDYQHSQTCVTPLMAAAARGMLSPAEQLINLGANLNLKTVNGLTALDIARQFEHRESVNLLLTSADQNEEKVNDIVEDARACSEEDRQLLNAYHHSVDEDKVDVDLVLNLLQKILSRHSDGAVLIFLPGYDDIMALKDAILRDQRSFDSQRYALYVLHSAVQSSDQKKVFKRASPGVQKIILSTNIAESSITIDDVVFVIDSGKVKEKSYDALTSTTILKSNWISRANALQRCGRAGRCQPGECFHMFSRVRFESMPEYQVPEILRSPLQELCLHAKLLAPTGGSIADFLSRAPEPPSPLILRNAVRLLQVMDALDKFEDLTELGYHLVDLPIEPRLGKMILCSVMLKCMDPILTIACTLAYKDPFLMPSLPSQKRAAAVVRRKFSADTYSDHMTYLRVFHAWQKARADGCERTFCERNFVSAASMEMILGMRAQLLGQLRALGFVRTRGSGDIRDLNANSENWAVVKAAIASGLYPHVVRADREAGCLISPYGGRLRLHQSSVLSPPLAKLARGRGHSTIVSELPAEWLVYEEMSQAQYFASLRCTTVVSTVTVALFCGPARLPQEAIREVAGQPSQEREYSMGSSDSDGGGGGTAGRAGSRQKVQLALDELLVFSAQPNVSSLVLQLRQKWNALLVRRLRTPSKPSSPVDEPVIKALVAVLSLEEQAAGLQQPSGVGQRPRPISSGSSGADAAYCESVDQQPTAAAAAALPVPPPMVALSSSNDWSGRASERVKQKASPRGPKAAGAGDAGSGSVNALPHFARGAPNQDRRLGGSFSSASRDQVANRGAGGSGIVASRSPPPPTSAGSLAAISFTRRSSGSSGGSSGGGGTAAPGLASIGGLTSAGGAAGSASSHYFVMKCSNHKCLDISMTKQVWATTPSNERKLNKAYQDGKTVYLIFSVQGSGHFQGFARMSGVALNERCLHFGVPGLGNSIPIVWMKRSNLPFQQTHHLLNSWNEDKKVQVSRDGQELEPVTGEALVKLWEQLQNYPVKLQQQSGKQRQRDGRSIAEGGNQPPGYNRAVQSPARVPPSLAPAGGEAAAAALPRESRDKSSTVVVAATAVSPPVVILQRSTSLPSGP